MCAQQDLCPHTPPHSHCTNSNSHQPLQATESAPMVWVISQSSAVPGAGFSQCRAMPGPTLALRASVCRPRHLSRVQATSGEPADSIKSALAAAAAGPVTDQAVPEGHQGLHNFLYASGDAEHSAQRYEFRQGEDDGSSVLPVDKYLESRDGERPLGVYALYDEKHNLQYVGYNRNIVLAVKGHLLRVGESRCAFIRPMVFANKAMATRSHMEQQVQDWLAEAGTVPPGNGVEAHLWDGGSEDSSASASASIEAELLAKMSPAERAAYEDKKLKLRKAMGESLHDDADIDATATQRRLALLAAVKGDNWSAVVSEQTQATLTAAVAAGGGRQGGRQLPPDVAAPHPHHVAGRQSTAAAAGSDAAAVASAGGGDGDSGPVVSPFSMASVHRQVGEQHKTAAQQGDQPAMTVESVTAALEDVRPYLLADGGDVTVMDVNTSTGVIMVELQGACSSCASSSATLKMGIERQLKSVFGEAVSEVIQVNTGGGRPSASVEAIDMHLNMLRSAVANLGGSVEVASVGGGVCVLSFKGPAAIGKGLSAAIKDAFPDVKEVVLRDA